MDASPNSRSIAQLPKNPQACRTDPPTPSMVCKPLERRVAWLQDWDWKFCHFTPKKVVQKGCSIFVWYKGLVVLNHQNNQKEIVLGYEGFCRKVAPPQLSDAHFVQLDSRKGITIDIRNNGHLANNKQVGVHPFCIESSSYPSWRELIALSVLPLVGSLTSTANKLSLILSHDFIGSLMDFQFFEQLVSKCLAPKLISWTDSGDIFDIPRSPYCWWFRNPANHLLDVLETL